MRILERHGLVIEKMIRSRFHPYEDFIEGDVFSPRFKLGDSARFHTKAHYRASGISLVTGFSPGSTYQCAHNCTEAHEENVYE